MANKASGETVLHRAARQGYAVSTVVPHLPLFLTRLMQDVVTTCLESKTSDLNARDFAGYTALHESCASGHTHIARLLLSHGADPNACAGRGIRVLHDAIEHDRLQVVRLLLSYGADPSISTYKGTTPLQLAQSKAMVQLLQGFMSDLNGGEEQGISRWKFSHHESGSKHNGFDVFADPAPECESESEGMEDLIIEESETAMCDTFSMSLACGEPVATVVRLSDMVKQLGVTRAEFLVRYGGVEVVSVSEEEFESVARCNQLVGCRRKSKSERGSRVELVRLDDEVRAILGIERTRVP